MNESNKDTASTADPTTQGDILGSVYRSLVQLGDLSRYRESELAEQTPNWSFAVGYYDLARYAIPSSGVAFNQLAVVALADGNLFQATYYLFRSVAVKERHPQAEQNIRKAFFKICDSWDKGQLVESASALVAWHLRLVSKCYPGKPFQEHNELEKEVSSRLKTELDSVSLEGTLRKLLLINFSACAFTQERFTVSPGAEENFAAYTSFLRLNLVCTRAIFSSFSEQLTFLRTNGESSRAMSNLRKLMALVRLSMLWVAKNARVLTSTVSKDVDMMTADIWRILASCLALTFSSFKVEELPECGYMFDEDADTVAFEPLICDQTRGVWFSKDGSLKDNREMSNIQRVGNSSVEFLSRIRLFLKTGMQFAVDQVSLAKSFYSVLLLMTSNSVYPSNTTQAWPRSLVEKPRPRVRSIRKTSTCQTRLVNRLQTGLRRTIKLLRTWSLASSAPPSWIRMKKMPPRVSQQAHQDSRLDLTPPMNCCRQYKATPSARSATAIPTALIWPR